MTPTPSRKMRFAVLGAAGLAVAGGIAFSAASRNHPMTNAAVDQRVTVDAQSCQPNDITIKGGKRRFEILNSSDRPIEWEILDGVMVVAERENIAPGYRATLEVQLQPGRYDMTCGLLSNPRGSLTVTASDEATAAASEVTLRKFLGPLSEYRVYLVMQGNQAIAKAKALHQAIEAGDLAAAQAAWREARLPYRRIEPLANRISDLENSIDPQARYLEKHEDDAGFTGYHRLEYGLFAKASTEGLAPIAARLVSDLEALAPRLKETPLTPATLMALPRDMASQIATGQIPEGENLYAGNDLDDLTASLEGIGKLTGLLGQVAANAQPELAEALAQASATTAQDLTETNAVNYADLPEATRTRLAEDFAKIAESLSALEPALGVN